MNDSSSLSCSIAGLVSRLLALAHQRTGLCLRPTTPPATLLTLLLTLLLTVLLTLMLGAQCMVAEADRGGQPRERRPGDAELRGLAARALADERVQREMPGSSAALEPTQSRRLEDSGSAAARRPIIGGERRTRDRRHPFGTGPFGLLMAMVVGGLLLGVLLWVGWWLLQEMRSLRAESARLPEPESAAPIREAPAAVGRQHADRLAEDGRYGEAARALLVDVLLRLEGALGGRVGASCTSREVLRAMGDDRQRRAALVTLIVAVEHSVFGDMQLGSPDLERCREAWGRLSSGYGPELRS